MARHCASALCTLLGLAGSARAQALAYQNTELGRPFRVEDAYAVPRYALDLFVAPRWSSESARGASEWSLTPGLIYGLVPRTQIELDVPIRAAMSSSGTTTQAAGVRVGAQYNFNVERRALPALGLETSMLLAAGEVRRAHAGLRGMATKSFRWGRISANSSTVFGDEPAASAAAALARWETGVSLDKIFPRRGLLLGIEGVAQQSLLDDRVTRWTAAAGARYQLTATVVFDATAGHTFQSRDFDGGWSLGLALSKTLAMSTILPGVGSWSH